MAEMPFEETYLVSDKLHRLSTSDMELAIDLLGVLPPGYAEFLQNLGVGIYCDWLTDWPPNELELRSTKFREIANDWLEHFSEYGIVPESDIPINLFIYRAGTAWISLAGYWNLNVILRSKRSHTPHNNDLPQSRGIHAAVAFVLGAACVP